MEDEYNDLVRQSNKFKTTKEERYNFGFLWGYESSDELTPEQEHMKELFEEVRADILDRGNNQIRNLEAEFTNYEINWLRYRITIPVKPIKTETESNQGEEDGKEQDEN